MVLTGRAPRHPVLRPLLRWLWSSRRALAPGSDRVLPSGAVQIVVDLAGTVGAGSGVWVVGPQTRAVAVDTRVMAESVGVVFRIGGAAPILDLPCDRLRDRTVDGRDLWGSEADRLRGTLGATGDTPGRLDRLEAFVVERMATADAMPAVLATAVQALAHGQSVHTVAGRTGVSADTLGRHFARHVGLTPQGWAGLARFQRATRRLARGQGSLAAVAAACGYADQAHFTRAFKRYAGIPPGEYRPRSADEPNHLIL